METLSREETPSGDDSPRDRGIAELSPESECLLAALEEGVVVLEADCVVRANRALQRMAGVSEEDLIGRSVAELLADAEGRPVAPAGPAAGCRLRNARGDLVPVSVRRASERVWIVQDRARERRLEAEIFRLSQSRTVPPLDSAEALPGPEFLGMIEHEIRTATTVIQGYTRMLQDARVGPVNPVQAGFLQETRRATERISSLLDNLLDLSSLECPGGLRIVRKPIRLHEVIRAAVEAVRPLLAERSLRIELELDAERDAVRGDPGRLEQVFINLLSNAAKFGPEGSEVRLGTASCEEGAAIEVSVLDSGPGVGFEERDRIFRPFVQGSAASLARTPGVGLGLAICRRILEAHRGTVEAVAGVQRGLFRVVLPCQTAGEGDA